MADEANQRQIQGTPTFYVQVGDRQPYQVNPSSFAERVRLDPRRRARELDGWSAICANRMAPQTRRRITPSGHDPYVPVRAVPGRCAWSGSPGRHANHRPTI